MTFCRHCIWILPIYKYICSQLFPVSQKVCSFLVQSEEVKYSETHKMEPERTEIASCYSSVHAKLLLNSCPEITQEVSSQAKDLNSHLLNLTV